VLCGWDGEERWQLGQGTDLEVGLTGQPFALLAVAVAPHDLHPEGRGGVGVPGIGGLKGNSISTHAEPVAGALVETLGCGL